MTDEHTAMMDNGLCPFCGFDFKPFKGQIKEIICSCKKIIADIRNSPIQYLFNVDIEYSDSDKDFKFLF